MNRREILGAAAMTGLTAALVARAADEPAAGHEHHHDHAAATGRYADLVASTSHCVVTGDACLSHCLTLLGEGDKEMAACARTVRSVIAACTALRELAAANSPRVGKLAAVVADICQDCETECRKHEKVHSVCHDCAEACASCLKECQKAAA